MPKLTFKKNERLTNKKTFDLLFSKGKSFTVPPLRVVYVTAAGREGSSSQLGISVPKRAFAKAVDRNKLKRRIREAYRKNKHLLYEVLKKKDLTIALMILYTDKTQLSYAEIEKKMIVSLRILTERI